ncbi:Pilus retraction protein PilT [Synechococcus sp. BL107]|nr:Pilus retraction protein PilT [Synechococcus sp. BL107]
MRGTKGSPSLETILRIADNAGHSDVHLGVGERPRFRARGDIQTTDWPTTDDAVFQGWLREILSPQQIDSFYRNKELDSAFAFPFVRVRINLLDSLRGPAMVLLIAWPSDGAAAHPSNHPQHGGAQPSRGAQRFSSTSQGTRAGDRTDWIWKEHNFGRHDRLDQSQQNLPHPHYRRSGGICA